ncbi:MAG TPA: hypothetical protein PKY81_01485 [bacterium]|nr:hypothetical protein [bacterium]HPN29607.1 hypothetical protein [bacterium]
MIIFNYAFENSLKTIIFKNHNVCGVKFLSADFYGKSESVPEGIEKKFYGFIIKIRAFYKTEKFFYIVLPERLSAYLKNNSESFEKDLNLKNVAVKFCNRFLAELHKILNCQLKINDVKLKISNCVEGTAKIGDKFNYIDFEYNINNIYPDKFSVFYKIEDASFFEKNLLINLKKQDCRIELPSLFESTKSDIQMTLNIFLRNGASITNLAEMIYCYPELKNKILGNVSKNNRIPLEHYLERLNNPEEGAEKIDVKVLTETLNENLIPAFASIIEKNNLQINSYLKIKNLNEIFEYYNLKRKFYDKPFDYWIERILKSENKVLYESELLKKEYMIGLSDLDELILRTLFSNLSLKSFEDLKTDLNFYKNKFSELDILKSKNALVSLISEYEITDETFQTARARAVEYVKDTKSGVSVQFISRQINQTDLFIALKHINDKDIEKKFLDNFSKNARRDYRDFNPVNLSKYKIYRAIASISEKYGELFENMKIKTAAK